MESALCRKDLRQSPAISAYKHGKYRFEKRENLEQELQLLTSALTRHEKVARAH